jgi:hypothetical protein
MSFFAFPFEEYLIVDPDMLDLDDPTVASLIEEFETGADDSQESDDAADWQWFCEHLETVHRLRPVSPREVAAHGIPPDARVVVTRDGGRLHMEVFKPL